MFAAGSAARRELGSLSRAQWGRAERRDGIPTEWSRENFLWKQPLPGIGHSSPVIWDDRLFLTSGDPETGEQIVQAFDALTGKPLWEKRFDAGAYQMHQFNSFASSTPAVDAEHVYVMWLARRPHQCWPR